MTPSTTVLDPSVYGVMAEFQTPEELLAAIAQVRAAGFTCMDAYAPFPVEGLTEALAIKSRGIPLATLIGGLSGGACGYFMQWYSAVIDYPLNIGGRPYHSVPSFIPITFEMTILFAAFSAVIAMVIGNRLPQPYHPVFNVPAFLRASQDRFFLCIEAHDPLYETTKARDLLTALEPLGVYDVAQ